MSLITLLCLKTRFSPLEVNRRLKYIQTKWKRVADGVSEEYNSRVY